MPRQYTIRNVPDNIDMLLRKRAAETGKSFNQVALEALALGSGESLVPKRDFSGIVGSMSPEDAVALEQEIQHQNTIDPNLWQ